MRFGRHDTGHARQRSQGQAARVGSGGALRQHGRDVLHSLRAQGAWDSSPHTSGRGIPSLAPPFCPGGRLMGPDDCGVNQGVCVSGVGREVLEHPRPHPAPTPAPMPGMPHPKIPQPRGPVPPGNAGPIAGQRRFYTNRVSFAVPPMAHSPRQESLNPLPLVLP